MKTSVKMDVDGRRPTSNRKALWSTSTSRKPQYGRHISIFINMWPGSHINITSVVSGRRRPVENVSGRHYSRKPQSGRRRPVENLSFLLVDGRRLRADFFITPNFKLFSLRAFFRASVSGRNFSSLLLRVFLSFQVQ